MEGGTEWDDADNQLQDPEELKVLFTALDSYVQYEKVARFNITHLRRQSFYALPDAQWRMLADPPFSFLDTLNRVDDAIGVNAELAKAIAQHGLRSVYDPNLDVSMGEVSMPREWAAIAKHGDIDKARSTLRQFYRDWTVAGADERNRSYKPIMAALAKEQAARTAGAGGDGDGAKLRVLVPGAGLGRLVFNLALEGYHAEGNEISYHQLFASSYILNGCERAGQHTIHPWVHTFSNHVTRENHLRGYPVPDIHPAAVLSAAPDKGTMSMTAADFLCLYGDDDHRGQYDAVAAVFFLDTAPNLIRYLSVIHSCLRPGGILINVGPLLWHFEDHAPGNHGQDDDGDGEHDLRNSSGIADPGSFELSDNEVMALVEKLGFVVETRETGIEAPYILDKESMLRTVYRASTWVARKKA